MKRGAGVLLNISSFTSEFGIGDFSESTTISFLDFIRDLGFSWWQILPMSPVGAGNSPYSSYSVNALNPLYVDVKNLLKMGLINEDTVNYSKFYGQNFTVEYDYAKDRKYKALLAAFANITTEIQDEMAKFYSENAYWLTDYVFYSVLKKKFDGAAWWEWSKEFVERKKIDDMKFIEENKNEFDFYVFEQYILNSEWHQIKEYANEIGIGIIGDMPIYVQLDSVDVWAKKELFLLDKDNKPTMVSGVPPDYFAADGQLWGNPIYDYAKMEKDDFSWWRERFRRNFELYDSVRIDHFRGLVNYWAVPTSATTAKEGMWKAGPKMKLLDKIKKLGQGRLIIAEDLGIMDDEVADCLAKTEFPGMRVMQFGFEDEESVHIPHNYDVNCVAYTATHDNNTTLGWLYAASEAKRDFALKYCGYDGFGWGAGGGDGSGTNAFIKALIMSSARIAIIPFQDLCGYGPDTRMNTPGVPNGNWVYRATLEAFRTINRNHVLSLNNLYGRNHDFREQIENK